MCWESSLIAPKRVFSEYRETVSNLIFIIELLIIIHPQNTIAELDFRYIVYSAYKWYVCESLE